MNRTVARRLKQREPRAKEVAAARPEPHTLRFMSMDKGGEHVRDGYWQVGTTSTRQGTMLNSSRWCSGSDGNRLPHIR